MKLLLWLALMVFFYHFARPIFWALLAIEALALIFFGTIFGMGVFTLTIQKYVTAFDRWWFPIHDRITHWLNFQLRQR